MYIDGLSYIVQVQMKRAQSLSMFLLCNTKSEIIIIVCSQSRGAYIKLFNLNRVNRVQIPLVECKLIVFSVISHALKRFETNGTCSLYT